MSQNTLVAIIIGAVLLLVIGAGVAYTVSAAAERELRAAEAARFLHEQELAATIRRAAEEESAQERASKAHSAAAIRERKAERQRRESSAVAAVDLSAAFRDDIGKARLTYMAREIDIAGKVISVNVNLLGYPTIKLAGIAGGPPVQCTFHQRWLEQLRPLSVGDDVTFFGCEVIGWSSGDSAVEAQGCAVDP
ncbi:MAG: hypothetical protein CMJ83_20920 [Planctomycetes bacterium]|nr:hypothetical protein [Planctomycetota bacterium]